MKSAKLRLALASGLFAGWIAWLGYLALPSTTPREVLSHAQFMVAPVTVVARIEGGELGQPNPMVQIEEVCWPADKVGELAGRKVRIANLHRGVHGWTEPGLYILPLQASGADFQIATVPRSPGYDRGAVRIYAASPQNRQQLDHLPRPSAAP